MLQNRPICQLTPDLSEAVAQDIHEVYRRAMRGKEHIKDPSTAPWDDLPQYLKDSCKQQAEHIVEKLCSIGFTILKVTDRDIELVAFTDDEVEIMAEMEHERWIGDRLLGGWTLGTERNANNRTTPRVASKISVTKDLVVAS
jgi:hypothetical protein